ncbi:MAG: hypothetical protein U0790_29790, partial [Isosphaeraceae bacterium]
SLGDTTLDVLKCNDLGLGQYVLLSSLPRARMSPAARDRLGVLQRKFGPIKPLLKCVPKVVVTSVGSAIPDDRLSKLTDRNWLQIIRRDWSTRSNYGL